MSYRWPSIVQIVLHALCLISAVLSIVMSIVVLVGGYWSIWRFTGTAVLDLCIIGHLFAWFVLFRRPGHHYVYTRMDIIASAVLAVASIVVALFCTWVALSTTVTFLALAIFESIYVATRKVHRKWNMSLMQVAELDKDATGGLRDASEMLKPV